MKKTIAILMSAMLLLAALAGCGGSDNTSTPDAGAASSAEDAGAGEAGGEEEVPAPEGASDASITVGIMQIMEHPSLDTIRESFLEEMAALGYGADQVNFVYRNGQGDTNTLNTIAQGFVGDEVDLIMAIATPTAVAAAAATQDTDIPVIFSAVTDPLAANLMTDPDAPDANVTGTSDAIPVESIFSLALELTPDIQTIGFVYNLGEPNSVSVIDDAKAYCEANGLAYLESTVTNTSEVQQAAQSLVGKVDAYFSPIDNTVATAMPVFAQVAVENGLPIYPGADSMVMDGGLATVGIDYTVLGAQTAKMAVAVLEGTPIAELPVETLENFRAIVNQDTAQALDIDISGLTDVEVFTAED